MLSPVLASVSKTANTVQQSVTKISTSTAESLSKVGNETQKTFNRVSSTINTLTGRNRLLSQSYDQIQERIKQLENTVKSSRIPSEIKSARRELELLERQANKQIGAKGSSDKGLLGFLGGAGGLLKAGAVGLGVGAVAGLGSGVSDSIKKSLERQQIQTSFDVLAGDKERGGALTQQLIGLQKDTILGSEVFKNAQTMLSSGFDSTEIYDNLKMIGDISMGDAGKLQSLTTAFTQVKQAGRLTGQELMQLINAGFNPLEQMSQTTGKSIAQLREEMGKGQISFSAVQQAFKDATSEGGRYHDMLAQIAETPAGKIQQLSGAWDEFKISAGNAFMPLVSLAIDLAQQALPIIEMVITPLKNGVQTITDWIMKTKDETGGWMKYVDILKNVFTQHILPVVSKLWGFVSNMVKSLYNFIKESELLKDIFNAIYHIVGFVVDGVGLLIDGLKWLFDKVVMPILNGIEKAYRWIKGDKQGKQGNTQEDNSAPQRTRSAGITPSDLAGGQNSMLPGAPDSSYNPDNAIKSVSGGGSKETNINIHVKEMIGSIAIYSNSASEGIEDIEDKVKDVLLRVLHSANRLAYD